MSLLDCACAGVPQLRQHIGVLHRLGQVPAAAAVPLAVFSSRGCAAADALHRRHVQHADVGSRGRARRAATGLADRARQCAALTWHATFKRWPCTASHALLQVAQLQQSESALTLHVAQLDKKLNDLQRVYMKGVKSTVESIRAGRAGLGGVGAAGALGPASDD
jgi:hypothetical protein